MTNELDVKILYITPGCFDKGGISRYNRYQIRALRELAGAENVFVYSLLGRGIDDFEEDFEVTSQAGGTNTARKIWFVSSFYSWAITNRPQAIFSAHVNFSGAVKALSILTGAKTFVDVYGFEVWSGMSRDARWGLRTTDEVISDCHNTARYLEDRGLRPKGSIPVVWDCVDLTKFFPAAPKKEVLTRYGIPDPASGINILTLGRISRDAAYKGYERLLDTFILIADDQPTLRLVYAGRGDMVEELRAKANRLGVGDRVFFTGSIHEDHLADVYRSAQIFSLVSESGTVKGEGIPLTPLEAAACGVPILVGNQDGSREAVVENTNGLILDPSMPEKLREALLMLTSDPGLRDRMGQAARVRIEQDFGFTSFVEKHRAVLARWFPERFASTLTACSLPVSQTVTP